MKTCRPMSGTRSGRTLVLSLFSLATLLTGLAHPQKMDRMKDGVEHWYVPVPSDGRSYFTRKFEDIYSVVLSKDAQPFGKSVAFLVGVSSYQNLSPQLPSVRNDIKQMRDLLLNKAGFDEVYVAEDEIVNRDLIEQYIKGIIVGSMKKNDRLLFYYSGHGGDNQGKTGYMLFGKAKKSQFWGPQVLAVDTLSDWSRELPIQHILFILDSCASGLAFTTKSGADSSDKLLVSTLSGNGSRTVLTAGTADEAAYALEDRLRLGNGVFTSTMINAFASQRRDTALITVTDLFADIEKGMAKFRLREGKPTTPRMWSLDDAEYRGTFVFLNTSAKSARLTGEQAKALGVTPTAKVSGEMATQAGTGIIEVFSNGPGTLLVDNQDMGQMQHGETRQLFRQGVGKHILQLKGEQSESKEVTVESGALAYAAFGLKSPIDSSGTAPVGTLVLQSVHGLSGEAFVDNFGVGHIQKDGELRVSNLTVGSHEYRIDDIKEIAKGVVLIKPNEMTYTVIMAPAPPSGLNATVQ